MKTTNYYNTFIQVAEDCPVQAAEMPPQKKEDKTVATLQFEMIYNNPYAYTSDDVLFGVYAAKNKISSLALEEEREKYFSKGQACFRSSPLGKRYGWGIHSNAEGKVAIYAIDSDEYKKLSEDISLKNIKAMRSKRA
ncbi:DUF6157 family protein [Pontibacter sp. SGAir0037]|uniref:DUF6157 family protein n=1 Tax=Pontibacter sp. SGAir0037 TaxID=2571030 RepID=UPI0010CD5E49|nr:DUF6157 family protein [Pontibacter sp. SGAir0037]QCR22682.1 hypothetical protein C1N53_10230 [Pontibacter sp. SGAir0037]